MERVKSMVHKWMIISNIKIHFYKALLISSLIELAHFYRNFENYKSAEIDLRIYCKPRIGFSLFFGRECITSRWTTLVSFSPIQCTVFEKMAIITYSHFANILRSMHQMNLRFGEKNHYGKRNILTNFQKNILHGFWENSLHHLQPICIFIEIRDVGISDFWCGYALDS